MNVYLCLVVSQILHLATNGDFLSAKDVRVGNAKICCQADSLKLAVLNGVIRVGCNFLN